MAGTMIRTRVCDLLNIKYPILQGGMLWLATGELAAAVSRAGGLGIVSPMAGMEKDGDPAENLREQIARTRKLTKKPFGINLPLDLEESGILVDIILREKAKIVVTASGSPELYTELFHQEGIKVLHVAGSVKQARFAASCNVDGVIVAGFEAGGHIGFAESPLFSLLPQVADAVSIPVIAAGGIADSRGMVAAFALGAEGVQLGTRFIAAEENIACARYKEAILAAGETGTVVTCRKLMPARCLRTAFTERLIKMEEGGASPEELRQALGFRRSRAVQIDGDLENGEAFCGAAAGLIKEILPAEVIVQTLIGGWTEILKKMRL